MNRRRFCASAAAGLAGFALSRRLAAARPPNVVIILADDLGWADLGCYGSAAIRTPHLDRLAGEGARMTAFYASGPVCSPSRAGLLTGRYPARTGVTFALSPKELGVLPLAASAYYRMSLGLPPGEITLADLLGGAGYATTCIGKWHLGDHPQHLPNRRGFDHFFGVLHPNDAVPLRLYRNTEVVEKAPVNQDFLTQKYTAEAVAWMSEQRERPFFCYLAHTFPHIPLHASPEFRGKSNAGLYGDAVEELDWSTGELLKTLDHLGLADNTLVVFTSDNGPWFEGNTGVYRGRKGQILEGGMRVPGIARRPGVIPAGSVCHGIGMNFDLFATALAAAGLEPPADRAIDGRDLTPLWRGEAERVHEELFYYWRREAQAVRTDRWKYHRRHPGWADLPTVVPQRPMLFDLNADPNECYNVLDRYPEVAAELEARIKDWEAGFIRGVPASYGFGA